MSTKTTKQQLPKWFNGELYKEGGTARNRFSGEEYKLNAMELSMYDFIIGSTMVIELCVYSIWMLIKRYTSFSCCKSNLCSCTHNLI